MSKSSRIILTLLITSLILLTGCSSAPEDFSHLFDSNPENVEPYPIGKSVSKPVKITTLYENPLIIETITENNQSKMKISGLKNKVIESDINNRIDELFDKMKRIANLEEIPPYSGQVNKFDPLKKAMNKYYNVDILYNCNNILSISGNVHLSDTVDDVYSALNHHEAITLDLNTGNPIALSQLFLDGADWKTIVNDEINSYLISSRAEEETYDSGHYFSSNVVLAKPFNGIEDTFDFRLMNHEIHLIFDYEDTEFYTAEGSIIIPIQMKNLLDQLAFSERFVLDEYLYEHEISNMTFFSPTGFSVGSENKSEIIDGREWFTGVYNSTENELVKASSDVLTKTIHGKIETLLEEHPEYNYVYVHHNWNHVGPYVNYRLDVNLNSPEKYYWADHSHVFDEHGNPLTIDDLFIDSFDHENFLMTELKKALLIYQFAVNEEELLYLYESMMFQIHTDALSFVTATIERDQRESSPVSMYFQFKDIGIENLAIFD